MSRRLSSLPQVLALALVLSAFWAATAHAQTQGRVVTLASFTPQTRPEGLAVDRLGNLYTASIMTGEVIKVAPNNAVSTLATLRRGTGAVIGVTLDSAGNVLANVNSANSPESDTHGVWRVRQDGAKQLVGALPVPGVPNALAQSRTGAIYVSDSNQGRLYRIGPDGSVSTWLDHELLKSDPQACAPDQHPSSPGANGVAVDTQGNVFVANTSKAAIIRVPVSPNGTAGAPTIWYGPDCPNLLGADGISNDGQGGLYVAVNFRNTIVQLAPGRPLRTIATSADGLDFPSSVELGLGPRAGWLIVTNFANLTSQQNPAQAKPALLGIRIAGASALPSTGAPSVVQLVSLPAIGFATAVLAAAGLALRRHTRRPS